MQIGIDLGGTKIEGVLMDKHGDVQNCIRYATPQARGYQAILQTIEQLIDELETAQDYGCTIGIGTPGSISPQTGLMRNSNTVCLNDKPFKDDLETLLRREIRIENDANCFALSEATDGAGENQSIVFGVIIGTGTGGSIVVNQKILDGTQGIAGEWGHNPLGNERRRCYCGRDDCVETYLSGNGLLTTYERISGQRLNKVQDLLRKVEENNPDAINALEQYHLHFGRALANIINILDPNVIVLGGGLSNIDSLYTAGVEAIRAHVFSDTFYTRILKNKYGDSSGVRGAARLWPAS